MLAGNPKAEMIAEKLLRANIPVTQANLEKVAVVMDIAGNGVKHSPAECEYMVRNKLAPTFENVSMARSAAQAYSKKEHPLTPEAWNQLEPKVTHMLFQAGLRANKDMMNAAQTFIKKDIHSYEKKHSSQKKKKARNLYTSSFQARCFSF